MEKNNYITETKLKGVLIIERPVIEDGRGFFRETFRKEDLEQWLGEKLDFKQGNHSRSAYRSLRGIHIAPWNKLVTCTSGVVQQVVVDTRPDSPTFGEHISEFMGEDSWKSVYIPAGCGNAFLVMSEFADYNYQATEQWSPGREKNLAWDDKQLNIRWNSDIPILSPKDQNNPTLQELFRSSSVTNGNLRELV